jgi:Bacterial TniB protein
MNFDEFTGKRSARALAAGQHILNIVVEHADFSRVLESCLDMVQTMRTLKMPSGVLIQAEPGMGKTLLLQTIKQRIAAFDARETEPACLHIQLDSAVDTHKIAGALMLVLGYPMLPSRPNLENMNHLINKGLARVKPCALLIDEMQHVCEGNKDITARAVTDWLKVRMDAFNLPVICAGTRTLERLSVINPQFTSRATAGFVLAPFPFGDAWRQLLGAFAAAIQMVNAEVLNGAAAKPLHAATAGNLRALKRLLVYACMHAAERPDGTISMNDLAHGFSDANGHAQGRSNPFLPSIKGSP